MMQDSSSLETLKEKAEGNCTNTVWEGIKKPLAMWIGPWEADAPFLSLDPCPAEPDERLNHQVRTEREEIFTVSADAVPPRTKYCKINRERLPCQGQGPELSEPWVWALCPDLWALCQGLFNPKFTVYTCHLLSLTSDGSLCAAPSQSHRSPLRAPRDQLNSPQVLFSTSVN